MGAAFNLCTGTVAWVWLAIQNGLVSCIYCIIAYVLDRGVWVTVLHMLPELKCIFIAQQATSQLHALCVVRMYKSMM